MEAVYSRIGAVLGLAVSAVGRAVVELSGPVAMANFLVQLDQVTLVAPMAWPGSVTDPILLGYRVQDGQ